MNVVLNPPAQSRIRPRHHRRRMRGDAGRDEGRQDGGGIARTLLYYARKLRRALKGKRVRVEFGVRKIKSLEKSLSNCTVKDVVAG